MLARYAYAFWTVAELVCDLAARICIRLAALAFQRRYAVHRELHGDDAAIDADYDE